MNAKLLVLRAACSVSMAHDDTMQWKHLPHYWLFDREILH